METSHSVLEALGHRLGVPLQFDEHDQCMIALDKQIFISIKRHANGLMLYGMVREIPHDETALLKMSLSLNLRLAQRHQGSIILDEQSNVAILVKHLGSQVDAQQLEEQLGIFAEVQQHVIKLLADVGPDIGIDHKDLTALV